MYLFFDTETTGLPKRWNAPVTDLENWPGSCTMTGETCSRAGMS